MALICKANVAQNTRIPLSEVSTWINFAEIIHVEKLVSCKEASVNAVGGFGHLVSSS
jgi:hypothetical protein